MQANQYLYCKFYQIYDLTRSLNFTTEAGYARLGPAFQGCEMLRMHYYIRSAFSNHLGQLLPCWAWSLSFICKLMGFIIIVTMVTVSMVIVSMVILCLATIIVATDNTNACL